jgi:sporulation protein YlmC with PRC-barrel domain
MRITIIAATLIAASALSLSAMAQDKSPTPSTAQNTTAPTSATGDWRASKLVGLNVYNDQNEKIGDINDVLLDHSGKAAGIVIGVGGFLGMGEHYVMLPFDKVKFVNEPARTASTTSSTRPSTTGGSTAPATQSTASTTRSNENKWYPDHAVVNATKDQLKSMPQFKYS